MKRCWPRRTSALAVVLAGMGVVQSAGANLPGPSFCERNPKQCHPMVGRTRAHFLGLMQQVVRAVPKVPGYRCEVVSKHIDDVGYGTSARRAAPERMYEERYCYGRGTDPRKRIPDVTITVLLSMLPAMIMESPASETLPDLLVFKGPKGAGWLWGKIREWRDAKGVFHRGYDPADDRDPARNHEPAQEVVQNGPYLVSAQVGIGSESPAALDAFAGGFDRAAVSALMAREAERRKADRAVGPIPGVLR